MSGAIASRQAASRPQQSGKVYMEDCTIFPHIPKCGVTTLLEQFRNAHIRIYLDYDWPPQSTKYFQEACERRNRECTFLDFSW
jgi:hypothetical protein